MSLKSKLLRVSSILAMASCLLFTSAPNAVGESPVSRYSGLDGVFLPFLLKPGEVPDLTTDWYILWLYQANPGEFFRLNNDGSLWWHTEANKAQFLIFQGNILHFVGSGHAMFEATVDPVSLLADLHILGCSIQAKMTDANDTTGREYTFSLHWVVRDGVWVQDDVRFAPLGLGK